MNISFLYKILTFVLLSNGKSKIFTLLSFFITDSPFVASLWVTWISALSLKYFPFTSCQVVSTLDASNSDNASYNCLYIKPPLDGLLGIDGASFQPHLFLA
jgi:hypothetical protein